MISALFLAIIEVSLTAGIIILIIKLLSFSINKNYAAKWKKFIWLILAVRLLIPINVSFLNAPIQLNLPVPGNINSIFYTSPNNIKEDFAQEAAADNWAKDNSANTEADTGKMDIGNQNTGNPNNRNKTIGYDVFTGENLNRILTWVELAAFIWVAGGTLFILYHLIGYLYFRKQILR